MLSLPNSRESFVPAEQPLEIVLVGDPALFAFGESVDEASFVDFDLLSARALCRRGVASHIGVAVHQVGGKAAMDDAVIEPRLPVHHDLELDRRFDVAMESPALRDAAHGLVHGADTIHRLRTPASNETHELVGLELVGDAFARARVEIVRLAEIFGCSERNRAHERSLLRAETIHQIALFLRAENSLCR